MTRSGQEYRESLPDGREIRLDGERIEDVTRHPGIRGTAGSLAMPYGLAHDSERTPVPTRGGVHPAYAVPRAHEDLVARRRASAVWAEAGSGFLGRTPDCAASGAAVPGVRSPGTPAEERVTPLKPVGDALGSQRAGRHERYERFSRGGPPVRPPQQAWEGDGAACGSPAPACPDGSGLEAIR
ncbi:4-hydroxyphenylacetate 3-hydroxylase N-terminal domain-containing protein [Streptomyces sp. SP18CS02]|uniref:4-hydroxyphenylacetate 3-hydroxylase N-terminal domain-containing protein n=1 Tax=Streptomyces sp. SP18CS02 TaxID=3002531 RepID=UPI002E7AAC0B|nr:4-hydroxyphenylacetate 3-hydroxylase N-terminal domain-containing protein [Streptomyces sp. SP18CS02]MEE1757103.1 4-hydroxyphenylacetate 3-hydroxylase N-terminal domain-containing protein [Streptomyces sp. SP18CS02]